MADEHRWIIDDVADRVTEDGDGIRFGGSHHRCGNQRGDQLHDLTTVRGAQTRTPCLSGEWAIQAIAASKLFNGRQRQERIGRPMDAGRPHRIEPELGGVGGVEDRAEGLPVVPVGPAVLAALVLADLVGVHRERLAGLLVQPQVYRFREVRSRHWRVSAAGRECGTGRLLDVATDRR
ncbi:MAG: hypothetical protein HKP61_15195 [Dactylosporangium sp.]|nr:hypothetical protein [Dactylosporangium sp.]